MHFQYLQIVGVGYCEGGLRRGADKAQTQPRRQQAVIVEIAACRAMGDSARSRAQLGADYAPRDIASNEELIAAQPADQRGDHILACAEDKECVVAFETVDFDRLFDAVDTDIQPGAEHAVFRDHEIIIGFRADHSDRIKACAAIDAERRVDVVVDRIIAGAGVQQQIVGGDEGADDEIVVAVLAFHAQLRLVGEDCDDVAAAAAENDHAFGDAVGDEAAGDVGAADLVALPHAGGLIKARRRVEVGSVRGVGAEHLTDLERIHAVAAIEHEGGAGVVGDETVVAGPAIDPNAAIDARIVIDPLDFRLIDAGFHITMEPGHEILANQEDVVLINIRVARESAALHEQRIDAVIGRAAVGDSNFVRGARGSIGVEIGEDDFGRIRASAAIDGQAVGVALQLINFEFIVTCVAENRHIADKGRSID